MNRAPARRTSTRAAMLLIGILLFLPACGRKAKPEPKWGGSGAILPVPAARVATAPGTVPG